MKTTRLLSIVLTVILIISCIPVFASAEGETQLQFGSDGKFKIMLFADIQDDDPIEETTLQMMRECLDKYKPDLVVYLGDNGVAYTEKEYSTVKAITAPCVEKGVPYAIVFGNHDGEREVSREKLLTYYQEFGCLTTDADPDIYGCGNCNLPILSSDGKKTAFNLWLIDSGSSNPDKEVGGYDYVHEDQIEWYKEQISHLKENGCKDAVLITHIPINAYRKASACAYKKDINLKELTPAQALGDECWEADYKESTGVQYEDISSFPLDDGVFSAVKEMGLTTHILAGHDHVNNWIIRYEGIQLIFALNTGPGCYWNPVLNGGTVFRITRDGIKDVHHEYVDVSHLL